MADARTPGDAQPAILIVDPSKVTLIAARKLLEPHFGVYLAEDGLQAWELIESIQEIAAVFTEQNLPGLDGNALLTRVRNSDDERISNLPVIIITSGERNEATRRAGFDAGATDFVIKPFDAVDLLTRARAWSSTSQRAHFLRQTNSILQELVLLDADTRAGNRDYFLQEMIKDRSFCTRHRNDHALLWISIDNYERILREQGRVAAREAIALAADAIRGKCRREDTFARVDDASFALSLLQTGAIGARVLAERIRQAIGLKIFKPRGMTVTLTVSIGVFVPSPDAELVAEKMLEGAERSAKQAARAGGNQTHVNNEAAARNATSASASAKAAMRPPTPGQAVTISLADVAADPQGTIELLVPLLEQLGDADRLTLVDRLLVMTETPSNA